MNVRLIAILAVLFGFSSCMKKDQPMELPEAGDGMYETLVLGADYSTQFYYNLKENKVVHSSKVASWDLAFDNSKTGYAVYLNGGNGLALVETSKKNFSDITKSDYQSESWLQDDPNGDASKSAIGEWQLDKDKIYILRLDAAISETRTLRLNNVTDSYYEFEVGQLGVAQTVSCKLYKNHTRVYGYYDLEKMEEVIDVEPIKESWDIVFTRYGFTFYDQSPPLPYIVTGVLSNPRTSVFKDSLAVFSEIGPEILSAGTMSYDRDVIGYDWKTYDFDFGHYHVHQEYNYIIRTQNSEFYKLKFLEFYDNNGIKGSPMFEYKQIQ